MRVGDFFNPSVTDWILRCECCIENSSRSQCDLTVYCKKGAG